MAIIFSKHNKAFRVFLLLLFMLCSMGSTVWGANYTYIYQVIDLSGGLATKAQVTQEGGSAPSIPEIIKSSLVPIGNYSYYTSANFDVSGSTYTLKDGATPLETLPNNNTTIYVKYTYDNTTSSIDLSGNTIYYIKDTNPSNASQVHYLTFNKKYGSGDWRLDGSTDTNDNFSDNDKERHWVFEGNDPYKIYVGNVYLRDTLAAIYNRTDLTDSEKEALRKKLATDNPNTNAPTGYFLRSDLAKNAAMADNNNVRFAGKTTEKLFNTFFFDTSGHIVAANNVHKFDNKVNKYIYLYKNGKTNYGDIGSRFFVTGSSNLELSTISITAPEIAPVTIHIVRSSVEAFHFDTYVEKSAPALSVFHRNRLERLGCTLLTNYYSDIACETSLATPLAVTDIYVPYTFNSTSEETTALTNAHITFSTEENPEWFSMVITAGGSPGRLLSYDNSYNVIDSRSAPHATNHTKRQSTTGQYAFIGDPYSFRIICKDQDGKYAFVDKENASGYNNIKNNVRFDKAPADTYSRWALIPGTVDGTFQIFRRDAFADVYREFWEADNGARQITMKAQTSGATDVVVKRDLTATVTPHYSYTYNIVDNSGHIAIKYTVSQYASTRLDDAHGHKAIPEEIYSPYLEGETLTFYTNFTTEGAIGTLSGKTNTTPATAGGNIFVRYTTDLLSTRALPLNGKSHSVMVGTKYAIYNSSFGVEEGPLPNALSDAENFKKFVWYTDNEDPYNVAIKSTNKEGDPFYLLNTTQKRFILMKGSSSTDDKQVELLYASGADISSDACQSLALNEAGSSIVLATTSRGAALQQIVFGDASVKVFYRIIDKQGKIVVETEDKDAKNLGLPAAWKSPLVSTYHYWTRSNFMESGGTYTLKDGQTEIEALSGASDGYIYVTYDVASDNKIISQVDPTIKTYRDGDPTQPKVRQYDTDFNTMFMIKFQDGDSFYQERGDSLRDTEMKAVYPYANGDSGFNLYGDTKWNEDKVSGSSTRTRWSWYLVSEHNDPYRLVVTSWQSSHARKLGSDDVNTTFYNYWRTFYNSEIGTGGSIVTGTISDDPQVLDDSKTGGSALNAPTEYMLLGTENNYKLMTANEISGVADDETYGKHRPVKSFLQYWKTYETISRKGVKPKGGTALPYDVFQSKTENPYSYFSAENVAAHPVYRFEAWQNARPITPSDPTKSNSKKYEYTNHYYQNIQMGDGTFELVEHSIDGILVLLDKHGWEITRKPMAKTGDPNKASRDAAIRQFDSPMVKTYHFWSTATKTTGYHKYTRLTKKEGTGSSLADYPEVLNSNGNISDVYVTYDVRPEYAELATVTATKDGSGKITAVTTAVNTSTPFLIRQDGYLGYDDSGTLKKDNTLISDIDAGNTFTVPGDHYYWYLASNIDIDKEMGYEYATDNKTDGKEDEDVNTTSDGLYKPRTELETNIAYYKTSKTGFDPYNIQIYNQSTNKYLTTAISNSELDGLNAQKATFTNTGVTLTTHAAVNTAANNGKSFDDVDLHMTNQTFMAISDANGNMRIMPRFDRYNAVSNFTAVQAWGDDQPEDDKAHGQSTWLLRPPAHTYIIVDSLGREALRYTALSNGAPTIPAKYRSPLAKNFRFYKTLSTGGTYEYNMATLADKIDSTFTAAGLTTGNVYVRYDYNPDNDTDGILKGAWYHAKLNDSDVKVTADGIVKDTYADNDDHRWRFMDSAGDIADPYAVSLYNRTVESGHHVSESDKLYILMKHSSGTGYALMQAGTKTTNSYSFLDGSGTPAISVQSSYASTGTIDASKKLTLTPVLATDRITYKIITTSGKVALTSEEITGITSSTVLTLPEWMRSPLMKDDAYLFYSAATDNGDGTYTIKGVSTTSPATLDADIVYVRYDYEKSKKAVTSFGTEKEEAYKDKFEGLPYNYAPLDLSGKVAYMIGNISTSEFQGKLWSVSTDATIKQENVTVNKELTKEARLWRFTGNDPYEVTIQNPTYSTTKVLAGIEPDTDASWSSTPNDKYPLVKMVEPNDGTYTLNTFMVLKYNPNEKTGKVGNVSHCAGTLKLYVTGNDHQYIAESNSLAGGVYIYSDLDPSTGDPIPYKERLAASGEPIKPKTAGAQNEMIIYSSFFYRPVLNYHVITNDGQKALSGYALISDDKVVLPEIYQSPLLNSSDFTYYTEATHNDETDKWTVGKSSNVAANTTVATIVAKNNGDIYVRYTYDSETSPFKIANAVDNDAEDGTYLDWTDEKGLDLSGKTWYTIANMQPNKNTFSTTHGTVLGAATTSNNNLDKFQQEEMNALRNGHAPSVREFLWKLEGDDPYAIKISNGYYDGKYMTINSSSKQQMMDNGQDNQTFMLLMAHAPSNEANDWGEDSEGEPIYKLRRWTILAATGTNRFISSTTGAGSQLTPHAEWVADQYSAYDIRMSHDKLASRKILNMGYGSTAEYCFEFIKAPVSRKYHYHAIQYDALGNKVGQTWDAVLEHDWLQPVVLEDNIARLFCKYEMRDTLASGDDVTGTNNFKTRAELEKRNNAWAQVPNAQFYHDADLTKRVKDTKSNKYDIYPEIGLDEVYDIYFKYQIDNTAEVSKRKFADITSTTSQIAADATYYTSTGNNRLNPSYSRQAKWFFMVLDTDSAITATGEGDSRTFVGNQYFLRREDDGTVNWMNNAYALHKESADNYKNWSYSRIAEWYRKGDNDAFREGRWLWAFVGDDPYNMRLINFETAVGVHAESSGVYSLTAAPNCYVTVNEVTTDDEVTTYPVSTPDAEPEEHQYWGLCAGYGTEETISLLSTAVTNVLDEKIVNLPLYWTMVSRTANKKTTQSVEGSTRSSSRGNAIQLLPYEPVKYEDVQIVIRRDDEVAEYKAGTKTLEQMTTGLSKLYFAASERMYVAGDQITMSTESTNQTLPLNIRRAFCSYKLYESVTPFDNAAGSTYTVKAGPYPDYTKPKTGVYDEDGRQIYAYYHVDENGNFTGDEVTTGAQTIYASYTVTNDIFLKTAPTAAQVQAMADNNDHVYFMDFPDASGKSTYHHAYYDPTSTMRERTGDLKTQRDKSGHAIPEKKKLEGGVFVNDTQNWYNHAQYHTGSNRMESAPENLKWYFVGDPYKLQVFNTAGTHGANLARFIPEETNFQFVVDCVHMRVYDGTKIDERQELHPYKEDGTEDTEATPYPNRHYNKPYFDHFYWECVPTTSDEEGTFALRFKEDNQLLGYRNVYYYLAHDGLSKTYQQKNYSINLSYNADNEQYQSGTYAGYHTANNVNTTIKLVQPVKVYVTAHRSEDGAHAAQQNVVTDELSEYFGLGETISEVPRHLQRKFVKYEDLDKDGTSLSEHQLTAANATSIGTCNVSTPTSPEHPASFAKLNDKLEPLTTYKNPVFKFSVNYTVNDLSKDEAGNDAHLFTSSSQYAAGNLQWVDMAVMGNGSNWLYYNKEQGDKTQVSNYRTAIGDNTADGWNDGLKGLHWALVGDPYDFIILNRRRYEDGKGEEAQWLAITKTTITDYKGTPNDSVIWTTSMVNTTTKDAKNATFSSDVAAADQATHFGLQMWKLSPKNSNGTYQTGNADAYYFLRTTSLKTGADDYTNGNTANTNQTNNYWRMVAKAYPNATSATSYFEMVPYSLSEKNTYSSTLYTENYSMTMSGLGVTQQRFEIRTAVAKDEDNANNNCFDADVEIRTMNGVLKLKRSDMEISYGDVITSLPATLRRYGCSYKCFLNYDPATNSGTEVTYFGELEGEEGYDDLYAAMVAAETAHAADTAKSPRPLLTYVYSVDDDVAKFFTDEQDARAEDYTWANSYFYWEQTYTGSSVEVERTRLIFDHYVYNSEGKIIDEVWREERYTEVVNNPTTPYPTKGYLNTHTSQTPVYGDQTVQSSENNQKWSMTGDPYGFTLKNYAQYLEDVNAIVSRSGEDIITQNYGDGQVFAYVTNKKGIPYLAIIDNNPESATYGNITKLVDFEFSGTSSKTLMTVGSGINAADATGNSLATTYTNSNGQTVSVKPFYLASLMSYADMVVYHLIMAHQYSLDTDTRSYLTDDQKGKVNERMLEFLKYWGIQEHSSKDYFISTYDTDGQTPKAYDPYKESDIKDLLKQKGTLRNFLSYPVEDAIVERVGVDNKPQVPWYMKRQFCTYHIYQRDVQRSVVDEEHPSFQQVDDEWTGKTCTIILDRTYKDYNNKSYDADEAFVAYYAGQTFKSLDGTNPIPMTFDDKGVTKQAFNVKWESIFDMNKWTACNSTDEGAVEISTNDWRKKPSGYDQAHSLQGVEIDKIYPCHQNRKVIIDVIYEVNPNSFRFAQKGRNTTAWYQMMTNNETADGLLNFSYKDGIGGRLDRTHHYTNNYLWAPEGDPYGFVLRSRYATINGTGWDDVAVTTEGKLPKGEDTWGNPIYKTTDGGAAEPFDEPTVAESKASYTGGASSSQIPFDHKRIIHHRTGQDGATTDGATNAVYEMFIGGYDDSFLMHPTSAWMDKDDVDHESYYMIHNTTTDGDYQAHRAYLRKYKSDDLRYLPDANWRLKCTNEQLLPYFDRAGYVGGLKPTVAQNFTNQEYYNKLRNGSELTFADLTTLQNLVYGGTFYKSDGTTVVNPTDARPTGTDLPMRFVSDNLVSMAPGYYRIKAFSEDALNTDGNDLAGSGSNIKGITGPRYISGYRFESEKSDPSDDNNKGGRWLHFLETDMVHSDIHTYTDLFAKITAVDTEKGGSSDRDQIAHTAMSGNIEILPADFDPSSIFQFVDASGSDSYTRYNIKTQGLTLWARPGGTEGLTEAHQFGRTELVESTPSAAEGYIDAGSPGGWDNKFRLEDIGGAATTINVHSITNANWDVMVAQNLKTNYVCIDRNHRYRITCHTDNEMVEIGDHYTTDGLNGIQDTKWLLQPVGNREQWPFNEMPLRVEVQQGGVKDQELTEPDLSSVDNKDKYYYGTIYVPFDTRLTNTTDAAFTLTNDARANKGTVTMQSVSQLNGMGNPQYVPAGWPVVIRTNLANSITLKNQDGTDYATRHYVNMYLPYTTPQTGLDDEKATIKLRGEYLERTLTNSYIDGIESQSIMVFGIPFKAHTGEGAHEYDRDTKQVGWYTNENWARESHSDVTANTATDGERNNNKYVYHNKVYYPFTPISSARKHIVAIFDDLDEEEQPIDITNTSDVPWPCDVYDLAGRRVAENETPATLLKNHPALSKGVYIFGGRKVVVK